MVFREDTHRDWHVSWNPRFEATRFVAWNCRAEKVGTCVVNVHGQSRIADQAKVAIFRDLATCQRHNPPADPSFRIKDCIRNVQNAVFWCRNVEHRKLRKPVGIDQASTRIASMKFVSGAIDFVTARFVRDANQFDFRFSCQFGGAVFLPTIEIELYLRPSDWNLLIVHDFAFDQTRKWLDLFVPLVRNIFEILFIVFRFLVPFHLFLLKCVRHLIEGTQATA